MTKNKTYILATSSSEDWFANIDGLKISEKYDILKSISGKKALELFKIHTPRIILVDKSLADMSGISFYKNILSLKSFELPIVIFIDIFATKSQVRSVMELGADDFIFGNSLDKLPNILETQLQKRKRILQTILNPPNKTAGRQSESNITELPRKTLVDSTDINLSAMYNDYLFLDDKNNPGFFAVKDFIYISSKKDYTQIHTIDNKIITLHKTLTFWETFLPKSKFLRIHRQTIINLDHVQKVEPGNSYRYTIYLNNVVSPFVVSQRYSQKIKNGWSVKRIDDF